MWLIGMNPKRGPFWRRAFCSEKAVVGLAREGVQPLTTIAFFLFAACLLSFHSFAEFFRPQFFWVKKPERSHPSWKSNPR
jgi:hypothetical protein